MGPLLILVFPCFRENVIVTCKIVFLVCSLDNFLLRNAIYFPFLEIKFQIGAHLLKRAVFDPLFTFFRKRHKNSFSVHLTYIHVHTYTYFAYPINSFCLPSFSKITNSSCMVSLWCDSWCRLIIRAILEQSINMINNNWAKFKLECLLLISIYTYAKFIVVCKLWTSNDGMYGEDHRNKYLPT